MKANQLYLIIIALLLSVPVFSQDIMYLKNGKKDTVAVQQITTTNIEYKKYKEPDGPVYRLPLSELLLVQFADGRIEVIKETKTTPEVKEGDVLGPRFVTKKRHEDDPEFIASLGKNIIGINMLNTINGNINLFYERITNEGNVGFKFTVNGSFLKGENDPNIITYRRRFTTGVDVNFYPSGQGKIKYFIGPALRFGMLSVHDNVYWDGIARKYYNYPAEFDYLSLFFNNGITVNASSKFNFTFNAAVGMARFRYVNYQAGTQFSRKFNQIDGMLGINLGYRF